MEETAVPAPTEQGTWAWTASVWLCLSPATRRAPTYVQRNFQEQVRLSSSNTFKPATFVPS